MAKSLSAFLAQNAIKVDNHKFVLSKRFVDGDGNPEEWEIRCITSGENQKLRKDCMISVPIPGKRGQYKQEFDTAAYQAKLAAKCVVYPPLDNAELQDSYGVKGAEQLVNAMLISAEFDDLVAAILDHNGFSDMNELVEEAKN